MHMSKPLDLTTADIPAAVDGATPRGHTLVLGYVGEDGNPVVSFRGSTHIHGPQELAIWARKKDDGFARAIARNPNVGLVYYDADGPGPIFLSFVGRARVDASASDAVYEAMYEGERQYDAERLGVAVIIDVDEVKVLDASGFWEMSRDAD
jgi:hypothetical protein